MGILMRPEKRSKYNRLLESLGEVVDDVVLNLTNKLTSAAIPLTTRRPPNRHKHAHSGE
jgi:hypothetical protein